MNIKDFLVSNSIDYTMYKLSITEIQDIIVFDKKVTQSVKSELVQYKEQYSEWLEENKKEFVKSHRFLKNDLPIWHHVIRGLEPWSLQFDDCKSCDWHWSIICNTCFGKWEIICWKCSWKTIIPTIINKQRQITWQCQPCIGRWSFTFPCKKCWWFGSVKYYEPCQTCYWRWQILNQQTQQWSYCQQCRWMWKLEKMVPCQICQGRWQITQSCTKCNWTWQFTWIENYQEKVDINCTYCWATGRVKCPTCNWFQELTCSTCHGERKTYQAYMNIFEVDVKEQNTLLVNRNLNLDAIKAMSLEPKNNVTTIDEDEKKLLVTYGTTENIKIEKNSIWRLKGTLYRLESIETWEFFYIWYSKWKDQYFYTSLPPKNNLEELLVAIYKPILRFFWKIWWAFEKFINYLKWKNKY